MLNLKFLLSQYVFSYLSEIGFICKNLIVPKFVRFNSTYWVYEKFQLSIRQLFLQS
jgi:hypothetical protein